MWHNSYSPYAREERHVPDIGDMIDVSGIARTQGFYYPVLLTQDLASQLKPGSFLSSFGIRFEKRVKNVLAVLKTQMNPRRRNPYYNGDDYPEEECSFPFVVLKEPHEEKLISIRASVQHDEDGEPVVTLGSSFREAA